MLRPISLLLPILAILVPGALSLGHAQTEADGFTVQERAGIVLVKPQAWSKPSESTIVEFEAFMDRTASGAANAGYIEFRTKAAPKRQVATSRIVKLIVYPDPKLVKEVITKKDRDALATVADDLKATISKFPATKTYVTPALNKVLEEIAAYDSGKVKNGGAWIDKTIYMTERGRAFAAQIKPDILKANPASSFDLASDARFLAIQELAAAQPALKPLVAELSSLHGQRVRAESRQALLDKLNNPLLTFPEATVAVANLKALQPQEDPKSVLFLKAWDADLAKVTAASTTGKDLAARIETEMSAVKSETDLPQLSAPLDKDIATLNISMSSFAASKPSAALVSEARQPLAVCAIAAGLGSLKADFDSRQYLDAKDVLDSMSSQAQHIGPKTTQVLANLQTLIASVIAEFTRLREEGRLQAEANKPAEALATYEKAFAVIPDKAVGDQIALLKEKVPPKK